ncbi:aminotransferase class III-fold pyridoxal phosphate-dependent enzyme, partial [Streptomyces sp. R302]|uniref:aminotransferase class III-fold pyridoxal phosphate-dependent enzyme n=1 Tax=unclassified Streptomyces TaxID=2593676 RepID=UPI00145DCD57
ELDVWQPGEHNGTFRGNNPAFVTATAALDTYWRDSTLRDRTLRRAATVEAALGELGPVAVPRGRGLVWGLEFEDGERARAVCRRAFELGLLIETSGPRDEVVKLLPPLTVSDDELDEGLGILARAVRHTA